MKCFKRLFGIMALAIMAATIPNITFAVEGEAKSTSKVNAYKYHLSDFGETDVDPTALHHKKIVSSLAPMINNDGQVIGNRAKGGFLKDPSIGEWAPYINGVTINFHSITNNGDILVSLNRTGHPAEWMIWPTTTGKNGSRQRIDTDAFGDSKLIFTGLTNDRMAVGNLAEGDNIKPFSWKPGADLRILNQGENKNLDGRIMWINNQNQVAGFFKNLKETPPGVWSSEQGLQLVKNFRSKPVPDGKAELMDLLIAEDGTVYGTYQIKYTDPAKHSPSVAYAWLPYEGGGFKLLDLEGMRINGLNEWHTLVGSLKGQAAICEPGEKPIELSKIIPQKELADWELLEATSINNWGDLVGYGKYKGEMHIFYAKKDQKINGAEVPEKTVVAVPEKT